MIFLIDNYDSFTHNLYQLLSDYDRVRVVRNDRITVEEIALAGPDALVLSPGPGRPSDAGITLEIIQSLGHRIPILGICLGHQAICQAYGGVVTYASKPLHGKATRIQVDPYHRLFRGLGEHITVGRYHSLIAQSRSLPKELQITATDTEGAIMGLSHRTYPVHGLQFHPESILTPDGRTLVENFLNERRSL